VRDTLILFTQAQDQSELIARVNRFSVTASPEVDFRYYSSWECVFGVSDSSDVVADCEAVELDYVRNRIGAYCATLLEYQSMSCARRFLENVLPGLSGVVDTNYGAFVSYCGVLKWLSRYPERHFREGPPALT